MKPLGLQETYRRVKSANGPAQMLTYAFWGVLMAGMFQGVCHMCITPTMLIVWGSISAAVVPITVWGTRPMLRNILLVDVLYSAWIMVIFLTHEPHSYNPVYYSFTATGVDTHTVGSDHNLADWFHASALIFLTLHALYLADLTQRQILEGKRFKDVV